MCCSCPNIEQICSLAVRPISVGVLYYSTVVLWATVAGILRHVIYTTMPCFFLCGWRKNDRTQEDDTECLCRRSPLHFFNHLLDHTKISNHCSYVRNEVGCSVNANIVCLWLATTFVNIVRLNGSNHFKLGGIWTEGLLGWDKLRYQLWRIIGLRDVWFNV